MKFFSQLRSAWGSMWSGMLILAKRLSSLRPTEPLLKPISYNYNLTTTTSPPSPPQDATIVNLVLKTDSQTLTRTLEKYPVEWTPNLVDRVLKLLWNHGPKALQFFKSLDYHPTYAHVSSSFDHAIDIAGRLRDYKTLWTLVDRMRTRRLGPNPKTFAIITERYVSAGKPDRAIKIFFSMHEHGCVQDLNSFNTILDVLCKSKRVEMADHKLFKVFRGRFRADTVSYNIMANGWCLIKRTPKALEVLKEMVKRGLNPTMTTYNILLKGFFRAGQLKEAWEFFLQMKKRKCEIDVVTYTTVVHGFGVAGEVRKAQRVFNEMIGEGVLPSVATYNAFIQVLCKKDNVENAISVFEEMLRKGYMPNSTTYNVVIRGLCHVGRMEKAMEFMARMKDDECEPNVQIYNVVIRYFCDAEEIEKGLNVFEKMGDADCLPNLDTYNILISAMFVRKKSDYLLTAGKLLIEMVERGFLPRKFTFNRVLDGLLLTGNQDFAKEILRLQSRCGRLPRRLKLWSWAAFRLVHKQQGFYPQCTFLGQSPDVIVSSFLCTIVSPLSFEGVSTLIEAAMFYPVSKIFMSDGCDHILNSMKLSETLWWSNGILRMSCFIDIGWILSIDAQLGLASKGYSIASASQNRTFLMQAVDKKGYEWDGSIFRILRPWDGSIHLCWQEKETRWF